MKIQLTPATQISIILLRVIWSLVGESTDYEYFYLYKNECFVLKYGMQISFSQILQQSVLQAGDRIKPGCEDDVAAGKTFDPWQDTLYTRYTGD